MPDSDILILQERIEQIKNMGWIKNQRFGSQGGIGNTLEDLLGIPENNLPAPDFGKWELKTQRKNTASLLTLFHMEPSPRKDKIVSSILLPLYGWQHQNAGSLYPASEKSFRQTVNAHTFTDRGFRLNINWQKERLELLFDLDHIDGQKHFEWKKHLVENKNSYFLSPTPYWDFYELENKINSKLANLLFISADTKYINGEEYFKYKHITAYIEPSLQKFLKLIEAGILYVDFDARSGHNHGTKFRIKSSQKSLLYKYCFDI